MISKGVIAMLCITALEVVAIMRGIDGAVFGIAIAAIAGLGGYEIKAARVEQQQKKDQ